ncbi:metallophosphoesterase family protein [Brachybacterium saurashtrense]|uniref:Phosphoesterase n=1 Tax=Brachybacterium saurashtrense TaxID=556288 RepID=A0A345YMX3_9MICO|nr:metallophosphoesterase family protein [Brachybacterium saurashtrense]AXK45275.1 phosphoesterase [Brachybacterium saurashtrense]RRR21969.1 phosphoesterase [Brachybacterium saurashtrense]
MTPSAPSRRHLLRASAAAAATGLAAAGTAASAAPAGLPGPGPKDGIVRDALRFREDGTFTVVQFNDTQDGPATDRRTIALQEAVLDDVAPDFVVLNGDVIDGSPRTALEAKQALNNVVRPMEDRGIAWALTFGNHDEDSSGRTGLDEAAYLEFVSQYRHNVNSTGARHITGTGNQVLTIGSASGNRDAFALWLLDSGRYAPEQIAGQDFEGYPGWDWLRPDQVQWYLGASAALEKRNKALVPALAFQHIALWEHRFMWFASVDGRSEADHARAVEKHSIVGERHEDECPGPFNSGMFAAMLHRGDVKGLFVGHDHINTYVGDYYGIQLGYAPGTGFGTYGLGGAEDHRLRGARVFHLDESVEGVYAGTELRFAADYGIDLSAGGQPGEPADLPDGVR